VVELFFSSSVFFLFWKAFIPARVGLCFLFVLLLRFFFLSVNFSSLLAAAAMLGEAEMNNEVEFGSYGGIWCFVVIGSERARGEIVLWVMVSSNPWWWCAAMGAVSDYG
jgi:hypothetical protein